MQYSAYRTSGKTSFSRHRTCGASIYFSRKWCHTPSVCVCSLDRLCSYVDANLLFLRPSEPFPSLRQSATHSSEQIMLLIMLMLAITWPAKVVACIVILKFWKHWWLFAKCWLSTCWAEGCAGNRFVLVCVQSTTTTSSGEETSFVAPFNSLLLFCQQYMCVCI